MRSLKDAMELAGKCHLAWLDPEKDMMPTGGCEVAHDTGRWWDAMLRVESVIGFIIPDRIENAMLANIHKLMSNKYGMLLNNPEIEWLKDDAYIRTHNLREGMLALAALVKYRNNLWARETGHRLLETINDNFCMNGQLNVDQIALDLKIPPIDDWLLYLPADEIFTHDGTISCGRALEAIIWFYEATGDAFAFHVAERIAEYHFLHSVRQDGSIPPNIIDERNIGHNHSYLGTIRGLLLFGLLTGRKEYVEIVEATYRKSIWKHNITWSGWTPHDLGVIGFPDNEGDPLGEHSSCADIAQIALWLAVKVGRYEFLDDVERLVRARLLPSQIIDETDPRRHGAWGVYSHPFGQGATLDVFAAVLHTLTDIYQHVVTKEEDGTLKINMHFTISTPWAEVCVQREVKGYLRVIPTQAAEVHIRAPGWAIEKNLELTASGKSLPLLWEDHYIIINREDAPAGSIIELRYELPDYETVEVMHISGRRFCLTWHGDEVIACEPEVPIYK